MKITQDTIQFCIDTLIAETAQRYAEMNHISETAALRYIMGTKTGELLIAPMSYLYLESVEYVLDMLDAEQQGDWERWLAV